MSVEVSLAMTGMNSADDIAVFRKGVFSNNI